MGSRTGRQDRRRGIVWGGCLLVALALGSVARAEESPLLEHIDQKMIDIGAQLTNARKRLSMSSGVVEENPNGESGMGLTCCTDNLRTIAEKLRVIRGSIERIAVYYADQENGEAIGILGEMDSRLLSISTGAAIFGRAPDGRSAAAALTGFVRPWNEFRNGVQALRLCCPIPIPVELDPGTSAVPEAGESATKSKKRKKKRSQETSANGSDPGE